MYLQLAVSIDGLTIASWDLKLASGAVGEEKTTYGPDYDKSITLSGCTYRVRYEIRGKYTTTKGGIDRRWEWSSHVSKFEVSVDGYTLLDIDTLWD